MSKTVVITKICFKCGQTKPLSEFYPHPRMADGHLNQCKECKKRDVQLNYAANREYYHRYDRNRYQSPKRRAYASRALQLHRHRWPERDKARHAVSNAIAEGRLMRRRCEICGCPDGQAHHDDYSNPFSIRWLCFKHHRETAHEQIVSPI